MKTRTKNVVILIMISILLATVTMTCFEMKGFSHPASGIFGGSNSKCRDCYTSYIDYGLPFTFKEDTIGGFAGKNTKKHWDYYVADYIIYLAIFACVSYPIVKRLTIKNTATQ